MTRYIRTRRPSAPLLHAWLALIFYSLLSIAGFIFGAAIGSLDALFLCTITPCLGIVATMVMVDARAQVYPHAYRMISTFKRIG